MNPKVVQYWNEALQAYEEAKAAYRNHERNDKVDVKLFDAVGCGCLAVASYRGDTDAEAHLAAGDMLAIQRSPGRLGIRQAIEKTFQSLNRYRELVPEHLEAPKPVDL